MGIGIGILLLALGAILTFAVNLDTGGALNLHAVGWILMVVGALGLIVSMVFWSSWAGPGYFRSTRRTYTERPQVTDTEVVDRP
jgi:hypothetical protein